MRGAADLAEVEPRQLRFSLESLANLCGFGRAPRTYARSAQPRRHHCKESSNAESTDTIDGGHSLGDLEHYSSACWCSDGAASGRNRRAVLGERTQVRCRVVEAACAAGAGIADGTFRRGDHLRARGTKHSRKLYKSRSGEPRADSLCRHSKRAVSQCLWREGVSGRGAGLDGDREICARCNYAAGDHEGATAFDVEEPSRGPLQVDNPPRYEGASHVFVGGGEERAKDERVAGGPGTCASRRRRFPGLGAANECSDSHGRWPRPHNGRG